MTRPYLSNIIYNHKAERNIQLNMEINFAAIKDSTKASTKNSTKDSDETHTMHIKSKNIVILKGYKTDEIVEKLFDSFLQKCQKGLKEKMTGSNHVFDSVDALYYKQV